MKGGLKRRRAAAAAVAEAVVAEAVVASVTVNNFSLGRKQVQSNKK